ncbi:cupin domain-containing protein [Streptomyces sp. NPDC057939]|uniref:AraC family transcriptional regulator n=1 Tax=Streptomyces sp. NPDC057939 TaxID=3346284 RepID=UPI0036E69BE7
MDDALSSLLSDVRPQGAVFDQSVVNPPWSMRFVDGAPLVLLAMLKGDAWLLPDDGEPIELRQGDIAILTGSDPYTIADTPTGRPRILVHEGDRCTTSDGALVIGDGLPMCGDGPHGPGTGSVLLKGTYEVRGSVSARVLDALPRTALIPACTDTRPALTMVEAELHRDVPGRQVILDRLFDLLLVTGLREWFDRPEARTPLWYRAQRDDPDIGQALKLIHENPAHTWTVASLADKAGMSRAQFARRFSSAVGQSPMAYVTEWRICCAADLLARTDDTVDTIARRVGYANAYALSVAFQRTMSLRPSEHRTRTRTRPGGSLTEAPPPGTGRS